MTDAAPRRLFDLAQRNVLVTGGGRGLGKAMALGLAQHGANLALVDVDLDTAQRTAEEIEAVGCRALALQGDVTREEDAARTVAEVVRTWGRIDVLVNNAGISIHAPAEDTSLADFKRLYDLDVFGVFTYARTVFPVMARQGRGSIINIASICGLTVLVPQPQVAYNSAKAAVVMLTRTLAVEWARHGIRVNAIAPGYMLTPPVLALKEQDPARYDFWMSMVPMRRAGEPTELQGAAVYLASDASSYMTGHVLVIDGGYTCS
jgi:NAD(P)-dependent dehydrogenase (short-subunit alcohol dehydrogenase family)